MAKSDLTFGGEPSPSQIDLPTLLEMGKESGGWKAFEERIYQTYFKKYHTSEYNRRKLRSYGGGR